MIISFQSNKMAAWLKFSFKAVFGKTTHLLNVRNGKRIRANASWLSQSHNYRFFVRSLQLLDYLWAVQKSYLLWFHGLKIRKNENWVVNPKHMVHNFFPNAMLTLDHFSEFADIF